MSSLDYAEPYIRLERARDTNPLHMVLPDGSGVHVALDRTPENSNALDYF
jgi:hypothetical protein